MITAAAERVVTLGSAASVGASGEEHAADPFSLRRELMRRAGSGPVRVIIAGTAADLGGITPANAAAAFASIEGVSVELRTDSSDPSTYERLKDEPGVTIVEGDQRTHRGRTRGSGTVAFFSVDGGVGKSTLAAAVAWSAAKRDVDTLAVDLDVHFGRLGSVLGAEPRCDLVEGMRGGSLGAARVNELAVELAPALRYVRGSSDAIRGDELLRDADGVVRAVCGAGGLGVLDLSGFWNDLTCAALVEVDRAVLVTTAQSCDPDRVSEALELCVALGVPRTKVSVVLNMHDPKRLDETLEERLVQLVGAHRLMSIADGGEHVRSARGAAGLGLLADRSPRFSAGVDGLVDSIIGDLGLHPDVSAGSPHRVRHSRWSPLRMAKEA